MHKARVNALDLHRAAEVLFHSGQFAQSEALSILSIEESLKLGILLNLLTAKSEKEVSALWKQFRTHTGKGGYYKDAMQFLVMAHHPQGREDDIQQLVEDTTLDAETMELRKQLLLYSDCFDGPIWTLPSDQTNENHAKYMLDDTRALVEMPRDYPPEELAIRKKHMTSFHSKSPTEKRQAMASLAKELEERGFIKPGAWKEILRTLEENLVEGEEPPSA